MAIPIATEGIQMQYLMLVEYFSKSVIFCISITKYMNFIGGPIFDNSCYFKTLVVSI